MTLVLDRPQTLVAHFAPQVTQNTGTPHWWLAENGLTNQSFEIEATLDSDREGFPSGQEYIAGTCPTDAASVPPPLKWLAERLLIESSVLDRSYFIDSTTNLLNDSWSEYTNQPGTGAALLFEVDDSAHVRFFRYRIGLQD